MRRIDLFYQNFNNCLLELKEELGLYYNLNTNTIESTEQRSTKYANFDSALDGTIQFLNEHIERFELLGDFCRLDEFYNSYKAFIVLFPNFSHNYETTLYYWIVFAKKLASFTEVDVDLNVTIDDSNFKIIELDEIIIDSNFIYYNELSIKKSIMIFTLNEFLIGFLEREIHSAHSDIMFLWLFKLDFHLVDQKQMVLLNLEEDIELPKLKSILKLQVLLNGSQIKALDKYLNVPHKPHFDTFDYALNYIQFDSISNILNEYNNQYFLLDKYLKLYHIVENFMYKHKICTLQNQKLGEPFHIRDFQTIYDNFKIKEIDCITSFFNEVLKLNYDGDKFLKLTRDKWSLLETIDPLMPAKIDRLFLLLNLSSRGYNYNNLKANMDGSLFSAIVYKFRNTIVHNKDSQAHFDSTNLPESAKFILEKYLIPILEQITFHLIINKNLIVWYDSKEIKLY